MSRNETTAAPAGAPATPERAARDAGLLLDRLGALSAAASDALERADLSALQETLAERALLLPRLDELLGVVLAARDAARAARDPAGVEGVERLLARLFLRSERVASLDARLGRELEAGRRELADQLLQLDAEEELLRGYGVGPKEPGVLDLRR